MTTHRFYYLDPAGQAQGPATVQTLRDLKRRGVVHGETLVAVEGDEDWVPLSVYDDVLMPPKVARPVSAYREEVRRSKGRKTRSSAWETAGKVLIGGGVIWMIFVSVLAGGVVMVGGVLMVMLGRQG